MITDFTALPIFAFQPNWASAPKVTLRALTDLGITPAGREERIARLSIPALKQKIQLDTQDFPDVSAAVVRFLLANIGSALLVPLWTEAVPVTAVVSGTTIHCGSTSQRLFAEDRPCVLWHSSSQCALVEIASGGLADTQVTASASISGTYGLGDYLIPAFVSDPLTEQQTQDWLSGLQIQADAELEEAVEQAVAPGFTVTLPTVRGLTIFPFRLNRSGKYASSSSAQTVKREADTLQCSATLLEAQPRAALTGDILLRSRTEIATFIAFFGAILGRGRRFWSPSDQPDFQLFVNSPGNTTITVKPNGYTANTFSRMARQMILIRDYVRSAWYARKITAAVVNEDGTETLTLESTVPALDMTTTLISQLYLVRSEKDETELEFLGLAIASGSIEFTELPQEIDDFLAGALPAGGTLAEGVLVA